MMQALLQQQLGNEFLVESAGTWQPAEGQPANDYSILILRERGIDLTQHRSRWIGNFDLTGYSHIVCVGDNEASQVRELLGQNGNAVVMVANAERGGVPNPYEKGLPAYRDCLAVLDEVMPQIARQIR
jgi:protein-tyrosine-phosphatase